MKMGFASGRLNGTKQQAKEPSKELLIMNGAISISKGKPVYTRVWRSKWFTKTVKVA
jgi:hypothetical protein